MSKESKALEFSALGLLVVGGGGVGLRVVGRGAGRAAGFKEFTFHTLCTESSSSNHPRLGNSSLGFPEGLWGGWGLLSPGRRAGK